jgi:hypothetical protein
MVTLESFDVLKDQPVCGSARTYAPRCSQSAYVQKIASLKNID